MKSISVLSYRKFLLLFSTLSVLLFIFSHSLMPGEASAAVSAGAYSFFNRLLGWLPFYSHAFVRKVAHFCEYALLGFHAPFYRLIWRKGEAVPALFAVAAMVDEGLQGFVPGRAPMWKDVLLDMGGIAFGCLLSILFLRVLRVLRERRKRDDKG